MHVSGLFLSCDDIRCRQMVSNLVHINQQTKVVRQQVVELVTRVVAAAKVAGSTDEMSCLAFCCHFRAHFAFVRKPTVHRHLKSQLLCGPL